MKIKLNDLTCIITFENKQEEKIVKQATTWKDSKNAFFGGSFHPERVKNVCLGKEVQGYFVCFAGLLKEIVIAAKNNNIKISEYKDNRTHFDFQKKEWSHDELKSLFDPKFKYVEHQIRALQSMLNTNCSIIIAPTSAGKSKIIAAWMKLTKLPTLILNDRATLAMQLRDDFVKEGLDCGYCCGKGVKEGYSTVCTIQSVKKLCKLTEYKCLIIDEVQRASSNTFQEFLKQFGCPLKYGFSASPYNGDLYDYAKIRQFIGSPSIKIESAELIENEVMAKPRIYLVKNTCENTFDYVSAYDTGIVNNKRRNEKIINIANMYDSGVAILINHIHHGEILEEQIPGAVFIRGETKLDERLKAIKDFNEGKIRVLIGSGILNEGISISNMKVLIMASGNKGLVQTTQKIGRVLRITENKKEGIFYDFIDLGNKHLEKHSKQRISIYKKNGFNDITILDENLKKIDNLKGKE